MTGRELLDAYLTALRARGRAPRTCQDYARHLRTFLGFTRGLLPAFWQEAHGVRFAGWLKTRGTPPRAVHRTLKRLRLWCRWAGKQGLLLVDPTRDLELKEPPARLLPVPTREELEAVLARLNPDTRIGLRDLAVLETLYGTGLRCSELVALDLADLDLVGRRLLVRGGKGGRDRFQPLGEHLAERLHAYVERSRPAFHPQEGALFLGVGGTRLRDQSLRSLVDRCARRARVRHLSCHDFRRAFATHLLEGGAPLVAVKALLGHVKLATTAGYARVLDPELVREYRRTHPRALRRSPADTLKGGAARG